MILLHQTVAFVLCVTHIWGYMKSRTGKPNTSWIQLPCVQVGAVTGGVAAARWSPDGEVLSMVSGQGQLLLMNKVISC